MKFTDDEIELLNDSGFSIQENMAIRILDDDLTKQTIIYGVRKDSDCSFLPMFFIDYDDTWLSTNRVVHDLLACILLSETEALNRARILFNPSDTNVSKAEMGKYLLDFEDDFDDIIGGDNEYDE